MPMVGIVNILSILGVKSSARVPTATPFAKRLVCVLVT